MIKKIFHFILDLIAPRQCLCCGVFDIWLCSCCTKHLTPLKEQHCHHCKKALSSYGQLCHTCRGATPLTSIFIAGTTKDTVLKKSIHTYKYYFIKDLHKPLGLFLAHALSQSDMPLPDIIIPVPLHTRRLHWRGFNQSHLLAKIIATHITPGITIPIATNILIRTRYTPPQVKKSNRIERMTNLHNAFTIKYPEKIKNKHILLVDDVATTGATLTECATALKKAGAKTIHATALSRG